MQAELEKSRREKDRAGSAQQTGGVDSSHQSDPAAALAAEALTDGLKRRIIRGHNSVVAGAKKARATHAAPL